MSSKILLIIFTTLVLTGCVSSKKHEAALKELGNTQRSLGTAQQEIESNRQQIANTNRELNQTNMQFDKAQSDLLELEIKKQDLQSELNESQRQLELLRQVEAETKQRNEIYAQFVSRLQHMIDGGQLTVNIEKGRIVINLPDNVLFESGRASINPKGKEALGQVAVVLSQFDDRRFQIEGHTDDRPIASVRFPSNWELSTARALAVVHLLTASGVATENISAAGFGEFQPRADNETPEGRQLNRRIEIVMLPNLDILSDELPKLTP